MKRLKISDLSFCETELENERSVQGGMFRYSRFMSRPSYSLAIENEIFLYTGRGYQTNSIVDEETGATGIMVSNKTDDSLTVAGVLESGEYSDSKVSKSFAFSAKTL